ncbi:hypothetical protein ACWCQP_46860 [Streptomyces chartreusis]
MNAHQHPSRAARLRTAIQARLIRTARSDAGFGTLEMLVLGAVVLAGATVAVLAWQGALDSLVEQFKSATGQ